MKFECECTWCGLVCAVGVDAKQYVVLGSAKLLGSIVLKSPSPGMDLQDVIIHPPHYSQHISHENHSRNLNDRLTPVRSQQMSHLISLSLGKNRLDFADVWNYSGRKPSLRLTFKV